MVRFQFRSALFAVDMVLLLLTGIPYFVIYISLLISKGIQSRSNQ